MLVGFLEVPNNGEKAGIHGSLWSNKVDTVDGAFIAWMVSPIEF